MKYKAIIELGEFDSADSAKRALFENPILENSTRIVEIQECNHNEDDPNNTFSESELIPNLWVCNVCGMEASF